VEGVPDTTDVQIDESPFNIGRLNIYGAFRIVS